MNGWSRVSQPTGCTELRLVQVRPPLRPCVCKVGLEHVPCVDLSSCLQGSDVSMVLAPSLSAACC